jgi:hypothetical protein
VRLCAVLTSCGRSFHRCAPNDAIGSEDYFSCRRNKIVAGLLCRIASISLLFHHVVSHAEPVNATVCTRVYKSPSDLGKTAREKQIQPPVFLFSLSSSSSSPSPSGTSSSSSISMHCLVNLFVVSCTIKPDVFSSCSVVLTRRTQGQLSNNIAACVCLYVVGATSCS